MPWSTCNRLVENEREKKKLLFSYGNAWLTITRPYRRSVVGGDTFSPVAPVLGLEKKKIGYVTRFHYFDGGQYDTKYVTFE